MSSGASLGYRAPKGRFRPIPYHLVPGRKSQQAAIWLLLALAMTGCQDTKDTMEWRQKQGYDRHPWHARAQEWDCRRCHEGTAIMDHREDAWRPLDHADWWPGCAECHGWDEQPEGIAQVSLYGPTMRGTR